MKSIPTVYELRKKGWKVRIGHHRIYYRFDPRTGKKSQESFLKAEQEQYHPDWYLQATGGITSVQVKIPSYKEEEFIGYAVCSFEEQYNRKTGIKKALARALASWMQDQKNEGN
jgi:hypothetical protein